MLKWSLNQGSVAVIGHSFGGHAFGLHPNSNTTLGLFAYGTGAGSHIYMDRLEQARVVFLWNLVCPIIAKIYGYLPLSLFKMGEDLPMGVYLQWKRWCSFPKYFFDDPSFPFKNDFMSINRTIVAFNSTDDKWAPPSSAAAFFQGYTSAKIEYKILKPAENKMKNVGHMGYFRPQAEEYIWKPALEWLKNLKNESRKF